MAVAVVPAAAAVAAVVAFAVDTAGVVGIELAVVADYEAGTDSPEPPAAGVGEAYRADPVAAAQAADGGCSWRRTTFCSQGQGGPGV